MKKLILLFVVITAIFSCTANRDIPSTITIIEPDSVMFDCLNFNNTTATLSSINPDFSLMSLGVSLKYLGNAGGYMTSFSPDYDTNSQNATVVGNGIKTRYPSDTRYLLLTVPTTGYKKVLVQFTTVKSSIGAVQRSYSYTIDGTNYINTDLPITTFNPDTDPLNALVSLDFKSINRVKNNANFKTKINFGGANANKTPGNNRFDNVTL